MENKKVVYISGPITGVHNYREVFEKVEDLLSDLGFIPLSPARLPQGMTNEAYMRIDFAMIDSADAVLFLPGYEQSRGAMLEFKYCCYTDKKVAFMFVMRSGVDEIVRANFKRYLEQVIEG